MIQIRPSTPQDIPRQKELWALAFGDEESYVAHFYQSYYRPERVLVLEERGVVQAMTAWFDTQLVLPNREVCRAAYLYAVATHPQARGRGMAGQLLRGADAWFHAQGIPAVTTVPAQPSLHQFFGANGFRECFTLSTFQWTPLPNTSAPRLEPATAQAYHIQREELLADTAHIAYSLDALSYQAGNCRLSGGGLFVTQNTHGPACLCVEGAGQGHFVIKEWLGDPRDGDEVLTKLSCTIPAVSYTVRRPHGEWPFAMLKWLDEEKQAAWDWSSTAYLGLAFD